MSLISLGTTLSKMLHHHSVKKSWVNKARSIPWTFTQILNKLILILYVPFAFIFSEQSNNLVLLAEGVSKLRTQEHWEAELLMCRSHQGRKLE